MPVEFLLTSIVVVLLPGTGVLYTVSVGLMLGARSSLIAAIGCTLGIVPHLCASVFGVAALLHTSAVAFQVVKVVGVLYLAYLAWSMWRQSGSVKFERDAISASHRQVLVRGFLINILNPKLSVFFLAFLPQFVSPAAGPVVWQMLLLSGIFMLMTWVVFTGYGLLANQLRTLLIESPSVIKYLQRSFAGLFIAMGVKLALTER